MKLTITIPTLASRRDKLAGLLDVLLPQCEGRPVEVIALRNHGEHVLAYWRQLLLDATAGEYTVAVDDDDMVPGYFVDEILAAAAQGPDVIGYLMDVERGCAQRPERHLRQITLSAGRWGECSGDQASTYDWTPVNPVRTEIARKGEWWPYAGQLGEDQAYRGQLLPYLQHEVYINKVMYIYRWSPGDTCQTGTFSHEDLPPLDIASPAFRYLPSSGDAMGGDFWDDRWRGSWD